MATNVGFKRIKNKIYTYTQDKLGLSGAYDKRKLNPDGIHTEPIY